MQITNITRHTYGWMEGWTDGELNDPVSTKITLQRMENQMVGTKITRSRVGQYKNNWPKGWVAQK